MTQLDPEIALVLRQVEEADLPPMHTLSAAGAREVFAALRAPIADPPAVYHISDQQIAIDNHSIPVRIYKNTDKPDQPALVWLHGGGWVLGDLDTADLPCRDLAKQSGCTVISVDYRLAPEAPFPASFDDSLQATEWVLSHAAELNIDPSRVAVGGDSAGANLAACVAIAARDKGLSLAYQLLVYPVIEASFNSPSYTENAEGYFLTRPMMQWFWDQYMPPSADRNDIRVAPLNTDLSNLPPAWVLTAQFDPLRDEALKYADALQAAGTAVERMHVDDTIHGFFGMNIAGGARARAGAAKVLRTALGKD